MKLNELKPAQGANKSARRVGRGIGSGFGKTCGSGHKGQKSRSGGKVRIGFEGGQMPMHQRLPKSGFTSRKSLVTAEIRLHELNKLDANPVTLESLREAGLINRSIKHAKVILSGELKKSLNLQGLRVTKGAREAIVTAGGKVD